MKIYGVFIGIDKHDDPDIRELAGAVRDAVAFQALFTDTIADLRSLLFTDTAATHQEVRSAVEQTLRRAGPDDTVLLSFSGHGTHDHRLVMHDSSLADLSTSTIPMDDLAQWFKDSAARRILCILDCCFSGGAPAKVLEDSPIPRTTLSLQSIAGEGRVIFAASNINEPAFEIPSHRHGLLSKTLLDLLQEGDENGIDILQLGGKLQARVRAEASRLGYTQTPVIYGSVTGGLLLPVLRAGPLYRQAFPERARTAVSGNFEELAAFGLDDTVLKQWAATYPNGLNELQQLAVNEHRVLDGESTVVVAPTSAGKTFIGEMAALRAAHLGLKAVFLLPYKALVNEKFDTFRRLYGDSLRVVRVTGDYSDQAGPFVRGKYDIGLLTYEMFLGLVVGTPHILNSIGLVVVDESQFLADPQRGITVELILTRLLSASEQGVRPQLITLGAVVKDVEPFAHWLSATLLLTHDRPVPLEEGVIDRSGQFHCVDDNGQEKKMALISPGGVWQRKRKPGTQDILIPLIARLVHDGEKVLVFRNTRGATQGCANYLAQSLGLSPATEVLDVLPQQDLSDASSSLRRSLRGGTAFHNTNLTAAERAAVEQSFRDPDGQVYVLVSTTTMAAGINTPADTVIIAETKFLGEQERPFTVSEYKNMAGRAGRLGYREKGRCVLVAQQPVESSHLWRNYVLGEVEPIRSSFDPGALDTWIIRLLAQVQGVSQREVVQLLANTFGGYLAAQRDPQWRVLMTAEIENLLGRMLDLKLLEEEQGRVSLTILGRACGSSALSLPSALRLVDLFRSLSAEQYNPLLLVAIVQCLPEADDVFTPLFKKKIQLEHVHVSGAVRRFGQPAVGLFQRFPRTNLDYYARAKRACILHEWMHGAPVETIERSFSTTLYGGRVAFGNIQSMADTTRWLLPSVMDIVMVLAPQLDLDLTPVLEQLEFGLPPELLPLAKPPLRLSRGESLALARAGLTSADEILAQTDDALRKLLEARTVRRLSAVRKQS